MQNSHVIANEVKQSHKSKFKLFRHFTPRNDIDGISSIIIATTIRSHWHWRSLNSNAIGSCYL